MAMAAPIPAIRLASLHPDEQELLMQFLCAEEVKVREARPNANYFALGCPS